MLFTMAVALIAACAIRAEEIDVNGDFEKCFKAKNGVSYPEQWHDNSTRFEEKIQVVAIKDAPKGGHALKMTDQCYITTVKLEKTPELTDSSTIELTLKVKGSGSLVLQLWFVDSAGKAVGRYDCRKSLNAKEWTEVEEEINMSQVKARFKNKIPARIGSAVITCRKGGEFYIDDFKISVFND